MKVCTVRALYFWAVLGNEDSLCRPNPCSIAVYLYTGRFTSKGNRGHSDIMRHTQKKHPMQNLPPRERRRLQHIPSNSSGRVAQTPAPVACNSTGHFFFSNNDLMNDWGANIDPTVKIVGLLRNFHGHRLQMWNNGRQHMATDTGELARNQRLKKLHLHARWLKCTNCTANAPLTLQILAKLLHHNLLLQKLIQRLRVSPREFWHLHGFQFPFKTSNIFNMIQPRFMQWMTRPVWSHWTVTKGNQGKPPSCVKGRPHMTTWNPGRLMTAFLVDCWLKNRG